MRSVAERNTEGVGGIGGDIARGRQKAAHHERDLGFIGGAGTDNGFLDRRRRVFGDLQAAPRGSGERNTTRLPERQRSARVRVHEGLLDCGFIGLVFLDDRMKPFEHVMQARCELLMRRRLDDAVRNMREARAFA